MAIDLVCSRIGYNAGQNGSECGGSGGTPTGPAFTVAGYDTNGELDSVTGFTFATDGALSSNVTKEPDNDVSAVQVHTFNCNVEPQQNSPDDSVNLFNLTVNLDNASSGFTFGTNGTAARAINASFNHQGTGDVGEIQLVSCNFTLGNGTDPIDSRGFAYAMGFGTVSASTNIVGPMQGYGFQPSFQSGATVDASSSYVQGFYDATNATDVDFPTYQSVNIGPQLGGIVIRNFATTLKS